MNKSQERLKLRHDVADKVRKLMERFNHRLTLSNPILVERYLKGEIRLLVQVRNVDGEYVAWFERKSPLRRPDEEVQCRERSCFTAGFHHQIHVLGDVRSQVCALKSTSCNVQPSVLVDVVQLREDPELMSVPSLVQLGCVDCIYGSLRHAMYFSWTLAHVFRGVIKDGKSDLSFIRRIVSRPDEEELEGQIVEALWR